MKQITIQITDNEMAEALDALAEANNYQSEVDGKPNPQTREDFAKAIIVSRFKTYMSNIYSTWVSDMIKKEAAEKARNLFVISVD